MRHTEEHNTAGGTVVSQIDVNSNSIYSKSPHYAAWDGAPHGGHRPISPETRARARERSPSPSRGRPNEVTPRRSRWDEHNVTMDDGVFRRPDDVSTRQMRLRSASVSSLTDRFSREEVAKIRGHPVHDSSLRRRATSHGSMLRRSRASSSSSMRRSSSYGSLKRRLSCRDQPDYYDFCWRSIRDLEKEQDTDFWRVLQERGVMDVGDRPHDYMPQPPMSSQHNTHSVTTVTKPVTNHHIQDSPFDSYSNTYGSSPAYTPTQNHLPPASPAGSAGGYRSLSPASSARQEPQSVRSPHNTPLYDDSYQLNDSRYSNAPSNGGHYHGHNAMNNPLDQYDSFDQQYSYRDLEDGVPRQNGPEPHFASVPQDRPSPNPPYGGQYPDRSYVDEDPYSRVPPQQGNVQGSYRDLPQQTAPPKVGSGYQGNSPRDDGSQRNLAPDHNGYHGDRGNLNNPYVGDGPNHQAPYDDRYGDYPQLRDGYQDDQYSDRGGPNGSGGYDRRDPYGDERLRDRPGYSSPRSENNMFGRLGDPRLGGSDIHSQRTASPAPSLDRSGALRGSQQRLGQDQPSPRSPTHPATSFFPPVEQYEEQTPYQHSETSPRSDQPDGNMPNYDQMPENQDPYTSQRLDNLGPYTPRGGDTSDPYGSSQNNFQGEDPSHPFGPGRDDGSDPYGSRRGDGLDPYGSRRDDGLDPYGSRRDDGSDPYGSRRSLGEDGRGTPRRDQEGSVRGPTYGEDAPQFQQPLGAPMPPPSPGAPSWQRPDDEFENNPLLALPQDSKMRDPDLPEVIDFLGHPTDAIKANAAAYLQHLCYRNDNNKAKTRALGGIPALVQLVSSPVPEVHRSACGALRNLSYGKSNDENKREIRKAQGIPALVRLLRSSGDNDVRELVTGILWNLSSCQDLKRPIVDEGLKTIVDTVIRPRWDPERSREPNPRDVYCSVVFRNASGILRNVSSDSVEARIKIRQCEGLVEAVINIIRTAIKRSDIDNKSVENCVCVLRNLSFACQEVQDKDYLQRRAASNKSGSKKDSVGCFGTSGSSSKKKKEAAKSPPTTQNPLYSGVTNDPKGQELLWHESIVGVYLPLLHDCTNPETLEAAAGAVQNLAACEWQPAEIFRAAFKKEKGLPVIVELLNLEADRVVCSAAMALRNLALDIRNKELIGKYAMEDLVKKLPVPSTQPEILHASQNQVPPVSNNTLCAVIATIFEVIKNSQDFAKSLLELNGVERLVYLVHKAPSAKYSPKAISFASSVLQKMWTYDFHDSYKKRNLTQADFLGRPRNMGKSPPGSTENTLHRPRMDQSGPTLAGYNENTLPQLQRQPPSNPPPHTHTDPYGSRDRMPPGEHIPMKNLNSTEPRQQTYFPDPVAPQDNYEGQQPSAPQNYNTYPDRANESYSREAYTSDLGNQYGTIQDPYGDRDQRAGDQFADRDSYSDRDLRAADQYADPRGGNPYGDRDPRVTEPYSDHDPQSVDHYSDPRSADPYGDRDPRTGDPYNDQDPRLAEHYTDRDPRLGDSYGDQKPDFAEDPYDRRQDDYRPPGGVPLFPGADRQQEMLDGEPLYAKVNKPGSRRSETKLEGPPGGADSWV